MSWDTTYDMVPRYRPIASDNDEINPGCIGIDVSMFRVQYPSLIDTSSHLCGLHVACCLLLVRFLFAVHSGLQILVPLAPSNRVTLVSSASTGQTIGGTAEQDEGEQGEGDLACHGEISTLQCLVSRSCHSAVHGFSFAFYNVRDDFRAPPMSDLLLLSTA